MNKSGTIKVGIQGAQGSFSEEAALDFCQRQNISDPEIVYLITSERVLEAVDAGAVDYGIMAMENAQGGVVHESIYALAEYRCHIVEMFHMQVDQYLLARPGLELDGITAIHSHPQALRQCREYLADHFWTRPLVDEDDTAHAAQRLAKGELPETAAVVGGKQNAELYGLQILATGIQDLKNNLTLFLGVTK